MNRETVYQVKGGKTAAQQFFDRVQQPYLEFFNSAPNCYLITDFQGIIHQANPAAQALLDMPQDLLIKKPIAALVNKEDRAGFNNRLEQLEISLTALEPGADDQIEPVEWKTRLEPHTGWSFSTTVSVRLFQEKNEEPETLLWALHGFSQNQVEDQLRKREFKFRNIVDQSHDGIALTDEKGSIVEWNLAEEKLTGLRRNEVLGRPVWEVIQQIVVEEKFLTEFDQQAEHLSPLKTGQAPWLGNLVETQIRRPNGSHRYIQMSFFIIQTDLGFLLGSIARDITERKQLELALLESSHQLENQNQFIARIIESIPSSLVVIDRAMRVMAVNHNFLEKTHREIQATLGHKVEDVFPQVLLDYTRLPQRVQEVFRTSKAVEGGKVAYRAPNLPSQIYYYRLIPIFSLPHNSNGKGVETSQVENVMLLMDDITEQEQLGEEVRRIERHLAGVVECANDLVISMDSRGQIVTWNRAAEMTSGLKTEQVKGQSWASVCASEQQQSLNKILEKLAHGANVQHTEASLLTANGDGVPIAWSCSPMHDDTGNVVGIVAVGRDLTEYRMMEDQLIQSAKMASLGVMAGGIAHELRNPLGIISASAQLILEDLEDAQLREQGLQKIYFATQRASLIIENLLKFARSEGGWIKKELDLHALLDETLALLSHQISLQKVVLDRQSLSDLPHIFGSREMLQQVFINLILNACNAMVGGGTLTIAMNRSTRNDVEISFSDTGAGIASEHLSKIFDPFFTTMPVGKGIGLGLSISHSIIQQHHGNIEVQSQINRGSTFTVRLPVSNGAHHGM